MLTCKSMPFLKRFSIRERFLILSTLGATTKSVYILLLIIVVLAFAVGSLIAKFYPIDVLSDLGPIAFIIPTWIIMLIFGFIANLIAVQVIFPRRLASLDVDLEMATFQELIEALRR